MRFRETIVMAVLREIDKADYLTLGSYRPLILENICSKILRMVIADCIVDMAKEYALLL